MLLQLSQHAASSQSVMCENKLHLLFLLLQSNTGLIAADLPVLLPQAE